MTVRNWLSSRKAVIGFVVLAAGTVGAFYSAEAVDYQACLTANINIGDSNTKKAKDNEFLIVLDEEVDLSSNPRIADALDAAIAANRVRTPELSCDRPFLMF